jgi:radical SAM protein with 4Fe4S-binding SPASM domain
MIQSDCRLSACLWELTLRCTMNCMHCGSVAGAAREKELTLDECFRVADELLDLGCREFTFIGGEVFLYKGWERIARYLSDKSAIVNIMSNAYTIDEDEIAQIKHARLSNVGISVDGMEENHNRIRRKSDSFARIKKAFGLLNREKIPIGVVTCLLDFNHADLEELYVFLVSHGVQVWQVQLVNPMGNMADKRHLIINPDKIPSITEFVREKNKDRMMVVYAADSIGYYDENEAHIRGRRAPVCYWTGCQAGITSIFIDSVGNVKGCGALYDETFVEGNVRQTPLAEIWNAEDRFGYNRKFDTGLLTGRCKGCDVGDVCKGGCRASNYFATSSLYESAFCCRQNETAKA